MFDDILVNVFQEVFDVDLWDVDFVEFFYVVFMYGSSYFDCSGNEGIDYLSIVL